MTKPFCYYFRVRYGECDAQKVVFNARYGDYTDISITEFLRALGYHDELVSGALDFQLVRQTTQWKSPARYDDVIEAEVTCTHVGNTSFSLQVAFRRAGETELLCHCETVYVLMEAHALRKRAVDDELRRRLLGGADGQRTDHAGWTTQ